MPARIMIIDDDEGVRELFVAALSRHGHEVRTAPNGLKALAQLAVHPADVVITDIFMPEKDGIETIIELRGFLEMPRIIAMSGGGSFAGMDVLGMAKLLGAHEVMPKPIDLGRLDAAIERQLAALAEDRASRAFPARRTARRAA